MTKRSLIDFIMEETNVPPRLIDDVQVMDAFSFITVPFPEAEAILNTFKKKQPRGEKSLVEKAKN